MPDSISVLPESAPMSVETPRRGLAPGPGQFVSRSGRWYPAKRPKFRQIRNPLNMERWMDVPETDADGKVILVDDEAAVASIRQLSDGKADFIEITKFAEPQDDVKEQLKLMAAGLSGFQDTMAKVMETQSVLIKLLVDANGRPIRKE